MFQTLVDIDIRIKFIWRRILGKRYTKELEGKYASLEEMYYEDMGYRQHSSGIIR